MRFFLGYAHLLEVPRSASQCQMHFDQLIREAGLADRHASLRGVPDYWAWVGLYI